MKNTIGYALTLLVSALTLVGCGKNNSNNAVPVASPYGYGYGSPYTNCAGCVGNTQLMTTAISQDPTIGEGLQLNFLTQNAQTYQSAYSSGYQQVAAQGTLVLGQTAYTSCGIVPGQYQVQTITAPAVMQGQYIQNMNMIATGPGGQLQVQISRIYFTSPTTFQTNGYVIGQSGYPCRITYY